MSDGMRDGISLTKGGMISGSSDIVQTGRYIHFKGGEYCVIGVAKHSNEANEEVVIYVDKNGQMWVRPKSEFLGHVTGQDGAPVPRFRYVDKVTYHSTPHSSPSSFVEWWEEAAKKYEAEHGKQGTNPGTSN